MYMYISSSTHSLDIYQFHSFHPALIFPAFGLSHSNGYPAPACSAPVPLVVSLIQVLTYRKQPLAQRVTRRPCLVRSCLPLLAGMTVLRHFRAVSHPFWPCHVGAGNLRQSSARHLRVSVTRCTIPWISANVVTIDPFRRCVTVLVAVTPLVAEPRIGHGPAPILVSDTLTRPHWARCMFCHALGNVHPRPSCVLVFVPGFSQIVCIRQCHERRVERKKQHRGANAFRCPLL